MAQRFKLKSTITDKSYYSDMKAILMGHNSVSFDMQQNKFADKATYEKACKILHECIVMELDAKSPVALDAIYCTKVIEEMHLAGLANFVVSHTPDDIAGECAFNSKKILFKVIYPQYYNKYMKNSILPEDIINAKDTLLKDFKTAARVKEEYKKSRTVCRGNEVDKIIFNAIKSYFSAYSKTDKGIMRLLADPELFHQVTGINKISKLGFAKIIEARGCYNNVLDFYFLNLPKEKQEKNKEFYIEFRKNFYEHDIITDILDEFQALEV